MPLLDTIQDGIARFLPRKSSAPVSTSMSGGIGNGGHGMMPFDDDMIVSKPAIIFYTGQIFFNFLAMACFASVASFQAHWNVGPSGLSGFAIFISVSGIFLSAFMLCVPVIYEKYDKFVRLARALKEVRVAFILAGAGTSFSLLIAFVVTISAWTEPGCKDPSKDPNADKGDEFKNGLGGWCSTKKAGAIFFWLAFGFWLASLGLLIMDWRSGKMAHPRDPPFYPPAVPEQVFEEGDDEESSYTHIPPVQHRYSAYGNSNANASSPFSDANHLRESGNVPLSADTPGYGGGPAIVAAGRPSIDAYGAFSDPPPSGFGGVGNISPSVSTPPPMSSSGFGSAPPVTSNGFGGSGPVSSNGGVPVVSRTMQYADPYAAVRASIGTSVGGQSDMHPLPSYESYQGYR